MAKSLLYAYVLARMNSRMFSNSAFMTSEERVEKFAECHSYHRLKPYVNFETIISNFKKIVAIKKVSKNLHTFYYNLSNRKKKKRIFRSELLKIDVRQYRICFIFWWQFVIPIGLMDWNRKVCVSCQSHFLHLFFYNRYFAFSVLSTFDDRNTKFLNLWNVRFCLIASQLEFPHGSYFLRSAIRTTPTEQRKQSESHFVVCGRCVLQCFFHAFPTANYRRPMNSNS